ncbi:hypothetical protein EVAR_77857_1 [Eumeta japonica]|uniref:Uncharacterized protein n=1 Tax=Eumeta variegata TaxID=151549 RepID=A0A4C1TCC0_EUMVA|nr:hypothetical protein EVAR_77857_1 [Eumeta japonica]
MVFSSAPLSTAALARLWSDLSERDVAETLPNRLFSRFQEYQRQTFNSGSYVDAAGSKGVCATWDVISICLRIRYACFFRGKKHLVISPVLPSAHRFCHSSRLAALIIYFACDKRKSLVVCFRLIGEGSPSVELVCTLVTRNFGMRSNPE